MKKMKGMLKIKKKAKMKILQKMWMRIANMQRNAKNVWKAIFTKDARNTKKCLNCKKKQKK